MTHPKLLAASGLRKTYTEERRDATDAAEPRELIRSGIVRDPSVHKAVQEKIARFSEELGLEVAGIIESSIVGTEGNVEFLISLRNSAA